MFARSKVLTIFLEEQTRMKKFLTSFRDPSALAVLLETLYTADILNHSCCWSPTWNFRCLLLCQLWMKNRLEPINLRKTLIWYTKKVKHIYAKIRYFFFLIIWHFYISGCDRQSSRTREKKKVIALARVSVPLVRSDAYVINKRKVYIYVYCFSCLRTGAPCDTSDITH